ncbi:MAG: nitrous oxide reductase accessory protein NosL [Bacteroidales bacterium]
MRSAVPLVVGLFVVLGCSSLRPVAINTNDVCETCKRVITQPKAAAEIMETSGLARKFRTVSCMARYISQHPSDGGVFVTDYKTGRFLSARSAVYVKARIDENTREEAYLAFADVAAAVEFGKANGSSPVDWPAVMKQTSAAAN